MSTSSKACPSLALVQKGEEVQGAQKQQRCCECQALRQSPELVTCQPVFTSDAMAQDLRRVYQICATAPRFQRRLAAGQAHEQVAAGPQNHLNHQGSCTARSTTHKTINACPGMTRQGPSSQAAHWHFPVYKTCRLAASRRSRQRRRQAVKQNASISQHLHLVHENVLR